MCWAKKTRDKNAAIDQDNLKMDFIVISPINSDSKKLQVALFNYHGGKHVPVDSKSLDL